MNRSESRGRRGRKQPQKAIHELSGYCTGNEADDHGSEGETYTQSFCVVTKEHKNALRNEAYTNLNIVFADMKGVHELKLKVDTGALGNTLAVRVAKQMYGKL